MNGVPSRNDLIRPVLEAACSRGKQDQLRCADFVEMVAAALNVSDEIRRAEVDSGRESVFRNRVRWAIADNFRAGLLDRPHRDRYMFNREGESLLREHPGPIDRSFLRRRFPKYRDWESGSG